MAETLLVVANEAVWPTRGGGPMRIAGLVDGLACKFDVMVVAPESAGRNDCPAGPSFVRLANLPARSGRKSLRPFVHSGPRLGWEVVRPGTMAALAGFVAKLRPRAVLWTHSYLAPVLRIAAPLNIVDFPNLEVQRLASIASGARGLHRWSARLEAAKAHKWEPEVARRCDIAVAVSSSDAAVLHGWGARHVVVIPNLVPPRRGWVPSPSHGPVTFMASGTYPPNREAARVVLHEVWPLVKRRVPTAELRLAGRGMDVFARQVSSLPGVEVVNNFDEASQVLAEASLMLAPVTGGGGTQLKVVEALTYGRVVAGSAYSRLSAPAGADFAYLVANSPEKLADVIVRALVDVTYRHDIERRLLEWEQRDMTWRHATRPLLNAMDADLA